MAVSLLGRLHRLHCSRDGKNHIRCGFYRSDSVEFVSVGMRLAPPRRDHAPVTCYHIAMRSIVRSGTPLDDFGVGDTVISDRLTILVRAARSAPIRSRSSAALAANDVSDSVGPGALDVLQSGASWKAAGNANRDSSA